MHWDMVPDVLQAHQIIRQNFLNARIPVATQLKPDNWAKHLTTYWDQQLVDLIRFGLEIQNYCRHMTTILKLSIIQNM